MAEAVVSFVIERLGDLLITEAKFLSGVKGKVEDAKTKLQELRCFLKDADRASAQKEGETVRHWIVQIREAAQGLEDVTETFVLKVDSRRNGGLKNVLKRVACILFEGNELHKEGLEVERIATTISTLKEDLNAFGIRKLMVKDEASSSNQGQIRELRRTYSHVTDDDFVGLDEDIKKLVAALTREDSPHHVVSICGMGGVGKTTLARKVYHHPKVRSHFECFAWVSISQQFEERVVWEQLLINLTSPSSERRNEIRGKTDPEVAKELYNVQTNKKCVVVLDDIWALEAWLFLKAAFPRERANSKILLTTRQKLVAFIADINGLLHERRCLDANESWELFETKSYFGKHMTSSNDNDKMKKIGQEMLKHCAGLPLAIVLLGGLVSTRHRIDEWEMLCNNVKAYMDKGDGQCVLPLLSLSYDELPYQLKPCFLQLAHIPEGQETEAKRLCHAWMAEGFISLDHQQTKSSTLSIEDVAYDYLNALVERNMLQVGELGSTGRIKSCRIHDLMRDLSLSKAREESFLQFIDLRKKSEAAAYSPFSAAETNVGLGNKVRRLAIYMDHGFNDLLPFINNRNRYGSLRSLIIVYEHAYAHSEKVLKLLFTHFQFLRVLKLEKNETWQTTPSWNLPKEIGKLIYLRLLSLRGSRVESIPSSIGNLRWLQTLDLRAFISDGEVPNVIWRLEHLRHLYLPYSFRYHVSGQHLRLSNVSNLQTLCWIRTEYLDVNDFLKLTNLKKLVLIVDKDFGRSIFYHGSSSVTFNCLRSLGLRNGDSEGEMDIIPVISWFPCICKLQVQGKITKLPEEHQFSPDLMKLSLSATRLKQDPMRTLEKLPNLRVLSFSGRSFMGNEMVCSKGGFPRLQSLRFEDELFQDLRIEEGALPSLRRLKNFSSRSLTIHGLGFLSLDECFGSFKRGG